MARSFATRCLPRTLRSRGPYVPAIDPHRFNSVPFARCARARAERNHRPRRAAVLASRNRPPGIAPAAAPASTAVRFGPVSMRQRTTRRAIGPGVARRSPRSSSAMVPTPFAPTLLCLAADGGYSRGTLGTRSSARGAQLAPMSLTAAWERQENPHTWRWICNHSSTRHGQATFRSAPEGRDLGPWSLYRLVLGRYSMPLAAGGVARGARAHVGPRPSEPRAAPAQ